MCNQNGKMEKRKKNLLGIRTRHEASRREGVGKEGVLHNGDCCCCCPLGTITMTLFAFGGSHAYEHLIKCKNKPRRQGTKLHT